MNIHVTCYHICVNREILEKKGAISNDVWEREEGYNDLQIVFAIICKVKKIYFGEVYIGG